MCCKSVVNTKTPASRKHQAGRCSTMHVWNSHVLSGATCTHKALASVVNYSAAGMHLPSWPQHTHKRKHALRISPLCATSVCSVASEEHFDETWCLESLLKLNFGLNLPVYVNSQFNFEQLLKKSRTATNNIYNPWKIIIIRHINSWSKFWILHHVPSLRMRSPLPAFPCTSLWRNVSFTLMLTKNTVIQTEYVLILECTHDRELKFSTYIMNP